MAKVIVKNKANGVQSEYTKEQWDALAPKHKAIFDIVSPATPKEIEALDKKSTETAQKSTQVDNKTVSTAADAKAAQKEKNQ